MLLALAVEQGFSCRINIVDCSEGRFALMYLLHLRILLVTLAI